MTGFALKIHTESMRPKCTKRTSRCTLAFKYPDQRRRINQSRLDFQKWDHRFRNLRRNLPTWQKPLTWADFKVEKQVYNSLYTSPWSHFEYVDMQRLFWEMKSFLTVKIKKKHANKCFSGVLRYPILNPYFGSKQWRNCGRACLSLYCFTGNHKISAELLYGWLTVLHIT